MSAAPKVLSVIAAGDVSDEIDYFVNNYLANERGMGLTACQPALVDVENVGQAIRFKIDYTFVDSNSNKVMGYGQLESDIGFVGEMFVSYSEENPEDIDILYMTSKDDIEKATEIILNETDRYHPQERPKGKY
jgi:hypothetical protein